MDILSVYLYVCSPSLGKLRCAYSGVAVGGKGSAAVVPVPNGPATRPWAKASTAPG